MSRLQQLREDFMEDYHEVENLPGNHPKFIKMVERNQARINEMHEILGIN